MDIRRFFIWSVLSLVTGLGSSLQCPSSDNESCLQRDRSYSYRFRSEALSQAVGTTDDQGRVLLECDVRIHPDRPCFYHLHLHGCALTADGGRPDEQTAWMDREPLPGLSQHPVSFNLENGQISVIKIHPEDPLPFVNIKRGVLSAFVFKMSQAQSELRENHTDVHGTCPMTSKPGEIPATVLTSKDMLHCHLPSRRDWQFSPWSLFWNMSFIQNVINSTTDCTYTVDEEQRRIEEVICKERHAIMLESTHRTTTAVQTNVNYHLTFVSEDHTPNPWSGHALVRKSGIQYEYEDTPEPQSSPPGFLVKARKMLYNLVMDSLEEVRLSTIPQFTDLVGWLRSAKNLAPLADSVSACTFVPKDVSCDQKVKELAVSFFSDALLQCNSLPCVKALNRMATKGDLSPQYFDVVYHTWSYMHHAEPSFIENFKDMCQSTKSHQCWLSLGSYIQRIYNRATDLSLKPYKSKVGKEAKEMAIFFKDHIRDDCDLSEEDSKTLTDCLIFMKAAGNMGKYYGQVLQLESIIGLLDQATNENSPVIVRVSALEALKDVSDPDSSNERHKIYDQLLPLLKNGSLAGSVRILAYDLLIAASEDHYFEEHLLELLKNEKNREVRHYVASDLDSLMVNKEFRIKRWRFYYTLNDLLRENSLSLNEIMFNSAGKSRSSPYRAFLNLPFLPDSMKRFGLKIRDMFLYDSPIYPSVFSHETVLQLFSALVPTSKIGGYFEGFEELLQAYQKNLKEMDSKPPDWSKMYEALMRALGEFGQNVLENGSLRNFDGDILSKLKQLHQLYWQHHTKTNPFSRTYLDLFGSTIKYFVLDSQRTGSAEKDFGTMMKLVVQKLHEGVSYNSTRVIRLIEAYHQVPTMMGLPLNWTTNATLAYSIKAVLKKDDMMSQVRIFLEPSAALTFLNRMVLDFPTVTQIGVQANSSAYTSTQLNSNVVYADGYKVLGFDMPTKPLKVLELFRTNQMIKHNSYADIPDWNIERSSSSWCSKERLRSIKFCLSKSYPNVTHLLRPWALMAGWCKWQFIIQPTPQSYPVYSRIEVKHDGGMRWFDAKTEVVRGFDIDGVYFKLNLDGRSDVTKMIELTAYAYWPDFKLSVVRNDLYSGKKVSGYKVEADLQLRKDFKYKLEISKDNKVLKSPTEAGSPPDEDDLSKLKMDDQKVSLSTPYSVYQWSKTSWTVGENVKVEANASYENVGGRSEWLKNTFPPSFWEDDKRASAGVRLHWKKPIHSDERTVTRQTEFLVRIPRYIMTLNGYGLHSPHREQTSFKLARTDINRGNIDAFLNLTFDWWSNEDRAQLSKDIGTVNLTIPRRSWEASFQHVAEDKRLRHEIKLRRALMRPKNDEESGYVGWWSEEVGDLFSVDEQEIKLKADNTWAERSTEAILGKYSTLTAEDLQGIEEHSDVSNHIAITYPSAGRTESVVYDGYIIVSVERDKNRFQNNFDLTSSSTNVRLTSHSVYWREFGGGSSVDHSSHFTHLGTGAKAYNNVRYRGGRQGNCYPSSIHHDVRSPVLHLTTRAGWTCRTDEYRNPLYTLRLKLDTNSSVWSALDLKLEQIIEDVYSNYSREEMTATHASGTIHVDAEWHKNPERHEKRVIICSKDGNCPNAELSIEDFSDEGKKTVKFSLPNRDDTQITYQKRVSSNDKILEIKVAHHNQQDGLSEVLDLTGEIVHRYYHVWRGSLNGSSYAKVRDLVASGYAAFTGAFDRVARDEEHPLNKILRPALKMSLYDYWRSLKAQFKQFLVASWGDLLEIFFAAESFTEPINAFFINVANNVNGWCEAYYGYLKEKTVAVWAIDYFHIPYYLKDGFSKIPLALKNLAQQLSLGDENVLYFKHVTGNLMSLGSFREMPYINILPMLWTMLYSEPGESPRQVPRWVEGEKLALIFGPGHVYTFDSRLYDVPAFPDGEIGPTYLLAHDVHRSLFTVLSTKSSVQLLFPEMSLTIDSQNRVYVDGGPDAVDLPLQSSNGKVTVTRDHVVEVWTPSLGVVCRGEDFLCAFKLSGYHRGGIIGLLGNADDYEANDFTLPSGNLSSSPSDFARAYEVSGLPEHRRAAPPPPPPIGVGWLLCDQKFEGLCENHPAVREQFLAACKSDVAAGLDPCVAASGLAAFCHLRHGSYLTDCGASRQETRNIGRRLEVVFLVQESHQYLNRYDRACSPSKGIMSLATEIHHQFKEDGYESIRYALVGFGGYGVHYPPSFRSVGEDVWLRLPQLTSKGLDTLELTRKEGADGIQALKYTIEELGRDSYDSKVIIAITTEDKQVANKTQLQSLAQLLEVNGLTLFAVSRYPSIAKGWSVFGARSDGLLFPSDGGYTDFPRGGLAKLAASTRGSVFLSHFLCENDRDAYFEEIAREVRSKVDRESRMCRACEPARGKWWWIRNECRIVPCS